MKFFGLVTQCWASLMGRALVRGKAKGSKEALFSKTKSIVSQYSRMICWLNVFDEEGNNVLLGSALPMPEGLTIGPDL